MTHLVSEIEAVEDVSVLPGSALRAGRQKLGLSQEAVADKLHLTTAQISALEVDDYRQFAAPIFIAGYIRSYARLLDLPIAPLLAALKSQQIAAPSLHSELGAVSLPRHRKRHADWAGMLAVGGLLLLLLVWLLSDREALPPPVPATATPQVSPAAVAADRVNSSPVAPEPAHSVEKPMVARTLPPAPPAVPMVVPAQPGPLLDHLRLQFSGDSWVEISDADGKRLFFNLGKQGDIRELQGKAPFTILLGNAPAVQIEYNGKPYNHQRYNRKNVARFSLGGPEGQLRHKE